MATPSKFDNDTFQLAREHLQSFIKKTATQLSGQSGRLLEVGP